MQNIKTWEDVEKEFPEHFGHSNTPNPMLIRSTELRDKLLKKTIATYKIATLIELGYGGFMTEEKWNQSFDNSEGLYSIVWNPLYKGFHIKHEGNHKNFISFRTKEFAREFMNHPENVELVKNYHMV